MRTSEKLKFALRACVPTAIFPWFVAQGEPLTLDQDAPRSLFQNREKLVH
jgi:hypothetical protein